MPNAITPNIPINTLMLCWVNTTHHITFLESVGVAVGHIPPPQDWIMAQIQSDGHIVHSSWELYQCYVEELKYGASGQSRRFGFVVRFKLREKREEGG